MDTLMMESWVSECEKPPELRFLINGSIILIFIRNMKYENKNGSASGLSSGQKSVGVWAYVGNCADVVDQLLINILVRADCSQYLCQKRVKKLSDRDIYSGVELTSWTFQWDLTL